MFDLSNLEIGFSSTVKKQLSKCKINKTKIIIKYKEVIINKIVKKTISENEIEHKFLLRSNYRVRIVLPKNLTKREAARLAIAIETFPF